MKKYIFAAVLFAVLCGLGPVLAQNMPDGHNPDPPVVLKNPLSVDNPQEFIGGVINGVLGVVGSLALLIFVYGGFLWMTAAGNAEQVEKGKQALVWAVLGLIVIFTSYAMVNFVIHDVIHG